VSGTGFGAPMRKQAGFSIDQVRPPSRVRACHFSKGLARSTAWPLLTGLYQAAVKPTTISLSQDQTPPFAGHPP
jgi:hypothetical protein